MKWEKRVYHPAIKDNTLQDFAEVRYKVLLRDNYKCQMCRRVFDVGSLNITAHHIVARTNGGGNGESNLVALCNKCHDVAEVNSYTKFEILNYSTQKVAVVRTTNWRASVYGVKNEKKTIRRIKVPRVVRCNSYKKTLGRSIVQYSVKHVTFMLLIESHWLVRKSLLS